MAKIDLKEKAEYGKSVNEVLGKGRIHSSEIGLLQCASVPEAPQPNIARAADSLTKLIEEVCGQVGLLETRLQAVLLPSQTTEARGGMCAEENQSGLAAFLGGVNGKLDYVIAELVSIRQRVDL